MEIDINCDLGEGSDLASCKRDAQIMPFISRCNIACGGHAGNPDIIRRSIENALQNNLKIGAHPSYPDRENFGRKSIEIPKNLLLDTLHKQVGLLEGLADEAGITLDHFKLHGALYNDAEADRKLAKQIIELFSQEYPTLKIVGLANGAMEAASAELGKQFIREGFMDRLYLNRQQLTPRTLPGSVITDLDRCLAQALALAKGGSFNSYYGKVLQFSVDTICLHGDTPEAPKIAERLFNYFQFSGLSLRR
ncbi:5-oxoprolinase subunit PxpA [Microbulbifer epialgicus]|uniref:5-oxoprolinase subunit PxpA n=1 Tax=Microbulbifer epialgicus TaxID=393907 RepID=A0ABV4NXX1_9GAMM